MPALDTYKRKIVIGSKTYSEDNSVVDQCTFSWGENGCDTATLKISAAAFDDFLGIDIGDGVTMYFDTTTKFWAGIVVELQTSLDGGLTIQCLGLKTLLGETYPTGRFGTAFVLGAPEDIATSISNDTVATGLAEATYYFLVTAIDDEGGESWCGSLAVGQSGSTDGNGRTAASEQITYDEEEDQDDVITVAWSTVDNAVGYRVYFGTSGSFTESQGLQYVDVTGTSFTLYSTTSGEPADFPFSSEASATGAAAAIEDADIAAVVDHLLDTYLPAALGKGTVSITSSLNVDLDDFDLRDGSSNLQEVLTSLAEIAGDVMWYVDEDGDVHFVDKNSGTQYDIKVRDSAVTPIETNVCVGMERVRTRDGITQVKVEGEKAFEDEYKGRADVDWDDTPEDSETPGLVAGTRDHRVHSVSVSSTAPALGTTRSFITGYASLAAWRADYPNLRWLYIAQANLTDAQITRYLTNVGTRIQNNPFHPTSGPRPRIVTKKFAGIRTTTTAGVAASNFMLRHVPNPEKFTATLTQVNTLFIPGVDHVRVITTRGDYYTLELRSASYTFGDNVEVSMDAGDRVYSVKEEQRDMREAVRALSVRNSTPPVWRGTTEA